MKLYKKPNRGRGADDEDHEIDEADTAILTPCYGHDGRQKDERALHDQSHIACVAPCADRGHSNMI